MEKALTVTTGATATTSSKRKAGVEPISINTLTRKSKFKADTLKEVDPADLEYFALIIDYCSFIPKNPDDDDNELFVVLQKENENILTYLLYVSMNIETIITSLHFDELKNFCFTRITKPIETSFDPIKNRSILKIPINAISNKEYTELITLTQIHMKRTMPCITYESNLDSARGSTKRTRHT